MWALTAHAFHSLRQPETHSGCLGASISRLQEQMRMATRDLREQINSGKISRSQFSPDQLKAIQSGRSKIPRLTWHHHQDRGRMQLVRERDHNTAKHIGGDAMSKGK